MCIDRNDIISQHLVTALHEPGCQGGFSRTRVTDTDHALIADTDGIAVQNQKPPLEEKRVKGRPQQKNAEAVFVDPRFRVDHNRIAASDQKPCHMGNLQPENSFRTVLDKDIRLF